MAEQTFTNHTKIFPLFHFFVLPVLIINLGVQIYRMKTFWFSYTTILGVLIALALILGFLSARRFALSVQDRVIRLEEQLRYQRLLSPNLQARAGELTIGQIVSLRFASDAELPELARRVLDEKLRDRKAIKQLIKNWKADELRA